MRRKLSDNEIKNRADGLKKRHRSEWCELVFEASVGRSMQEVATVLDHDRKWVRDHLKRYAIESASGGGGAPPVPLADVTKSHIRTDHVVAKVVADYAPDEPSEEYIEEYAAGGHTPEVAKCLALAYEAGENAIEAGVIRETVTQENKKAAEIILPKGVDWEMRLRRACSDVKAAAGLLDRANVRDLDRAVTRKYIAAAHSKWMEQIELLESRHPTFREEVKNHEA